MDEEKKEITENDVPVVENKIEEKEKKKQRRKAQKDKIEKKYPDKLSFLLGLIVVSSEIAYSLCVCHTVKSPFVNSL